MKFKFRVDINTKDAIEELKSIQKKVSILKSPLKKSGDVGIESAEENFKQQGRPSWIALKQSTKNRRIKAGYVPISILTASGKLRKSIKKKLVGNDKVEIFTRVRYAKYHHYGTRYMVMRRFLGFQKDDENKIHMIFNAHVQKSIGIS